MSPPDVRGDGRWRELNGRARQIVDEGAETLGTRDEHHSLERGRPPALRAGKRASLLAPPPVVILSGGRGSRLQEHTDSVPKPLVEVGGRPIVWHVIQIYMAQGFRRFMLLTGYKASLIEDFVASEAWPASTVVECLDTGEDTPTGGRVARAADAIDCDSFCLTYADGVADVDLAALLACHGRHGAKATMTVVQPRLQYGIAVMNGDDVVSSFVEKPRCEHWINGGFFCFERSVLDLLDEDDVLEREFLERLAADGELRAFRHGGYWDCMDTYKDVVLLRNLWTRGQAPWKLWE